MRRFICLSAALIVFFTSNAVSYAAQIIRGNLDEPEDTTVYTVTPGSGKCGDDMTWTLTEDGTLAISGTGDMYDYMAEYYSVTPDHFDSIEEAQSYKSWQEYFPWFENNNQKAITAVTIEEGVTGIAPFAFYATNIEKIVLPDSVTYVGEFAVAGLHKLTELVLSNNMTEIVPKSFGGTRLLTSLNLPESVTSIGSYAFTRCYGLEELSLPDTVTYIADGAFFDEMNLKRLKLPDSLEVINEFTFSYCDELTAVIFPSKLKEIKENAFTGCFSLAEIILPDGLEKIGVHAFSCSDPLKNEQKVYIPKTVTEIGDGPFNPEAVIYGFKDSAAEEFAKANGNEFIEVTESLFKPNELNNDSSISGEGVLNVINSSGGLAITIDGAPVNFTDAQPFIDESGRTQIPVRSVAEALNCKVDWDETARKATLTKDSKTVEITIGSAELSVDGETVTMDTTAQIKNDRTYIPLRFVGEALGTEVKWESN